MAMRETVGSLRAYFIVGSLLTLVPALRSLVSEPLGLGTLFSLIPLMFGMAYMYLGIRLKSLLVEAPGQVITVLLAGGVVLVIFLVVNLVTRSIFGVALSVVELLIVWYLYVNVRRLAAAAGAPQSHA